MRRPAAHRLQRIFAALLWVLASFAFIVRQQDMNAPSVSGSMPGMQMGAALSQAAPSSQRPLAEIPMTELEMAQMDTPAGHAGHSSTQPEGADAHHQPAGHDANAPPAPGNHAGHCPFCFTAAFSLSAFAVDFLAAGQIQTAYQLAHTPAAPRPLLGNKRARAPPLVG